MFRFIWTWEREIKAMEPERLKEMQEGIAAAKGVSLFREYTEAEAAEFLDLHVRTLAQMRREGRIGFVRKGPRNIRYLGVHVADFIIGSIEQRNPAAEAAPVPEFLPKARNTETMRVSGSAMAAKRFGTTKRA